MNRIEQIRSGAVQFRAAGIEDVTDHEIYVRAVPYSEEFTDIGGIMERFMPGASSAVASAPHRVSIFHDHGGPLGLQQAAKCGCVAQVDVLAGERGDGPQNMQARGEFMAKLSGSAEQQNAVKRHTVCRPIGGTGRW